MLFFAGLVLGLVVALAFGAYILQSMRSRQEALDLKEASVAKREAEIGALEAQAGEEIQRVAGLTKEQAAALIQETAEAEIADQLARRAREQEEAARLDADATSRKIMLTAMERIASRFASDATTATIELPSEDMKGRIIGREGRNIRAFEQITGVDVIVDETPEAVVLSCFDPYRREIARLTLMNLMLDGRIHPARIEQLHEQAAEEVQRMTVEAGRKAAEAAEVGKLPTKVIEAMGQLRFRTSYAQNVLDHSVETAILADRIAGELGLNPVQARRAAFLHDIGKALGDQWPGPHATAGMEFLKSCGEKEPVLNAVGAHHHDIEPNCPEALIVIVADTLSAARPGARRESLDTYLKRLNALEAIANGFRGVERSYAVQAGREIRLIVKPKEIDDAGAVRLSQQVARVIEQDPQFSVPVKVTVIRESRVSTTTKT